MTIKIEIQKVAHLDADQQIVVRALGRLAAQAPSLDDAERLVRFYGKGWFIHRGGNHIAVHLKSGDDRRMLFVTEETGPAKRRMTWSNIDGDRTYRAVGKKGEYEMREFYNAAGGWTVLWLNDAKQGSFTNFDDARDHAELLDA